MKTKADRDPGRPVNMKKIVLRNSSNLDRPKKTVPVNSKALLTMAMKLAMVSLQLLVLHSGVSTEKTSPIEISIPIQILIDGEFRVIFDKNNDSIGD
jgi:hypothetical protein